MRLKQIILLVLFTIAVVPSFAGVSTYNSAPLSGAAIKNGAQINLQDDQYNYMHNNPVPYPFINRRIQDFISLQYTGASRLTYSYIWTIAVTFNLIQYDSVGHLLPSVGPQTLSITYDPNRNKTDEVYRADYESDWGDSIIVQVTGYTISSSTGAMTQIPADVELTSRIVTDRYWKIDEPPAFPLAAPVMSKTVNPTNNTLNISWGYLEGAESYDVEWVFRSAFIPRGYEDFSQATRVNLSAQNYTINMAYDAGYICYRVRGVGAMAPTDMQQRKEGIWTLYDSVPVNDIDPTKNWTYSAAYAEDGKVKEVLSFFDGSTRQRQAITENNSQNTALISETVYDHEGRAGVTTLAAPDYKDDSRLGFYNQLNLSTLTGAEYKASDFDNDAFYGSSLLTCDGTSNPNGMQTTNGSSNYYSSANPLLNMGMNRALPDAQLLPFTETLYGPDGKVAFQAGPGQALAMGGNKTKYFYGTPAQAELDRVFGNEAGNATHYQEKVVQDPNGQVSVSYLNLSGKVVATCLAGGSPSNLVPLNENGTIATNYTSDIISENRLVGTGTGVTEQLTDDIVNPVANTDYSFTYTFDPAQISSSCPSDAINGMYDLQIEVTDNCGNPVTLSTTAYPYPLYAFKPGIPAFNTASGLSTESYTYVTYSGNCIYPIGSTVSFYNGTTPVASGTVEYDDGGLMELMNYTSTVANLNGSTLGGAIVNTPDYISYPNNVGITYTGSTGLSFVLGEQISFNDPSTGATIATGIVSGNIGAVILVANVTGSRAILPNDIIPQALVTSCITPTLNTLTTSGLPTQVVGTGLNVPVTIYFAVHLAEIGTYHVSKILSIDPIGITDAKASYSALFASNTSTGPGCQPNLLTDLNNYSSNVNNSECNTCAQNCAIAAASSTDPNFLTNCDNNCNQGPNIYVDPCQSLLTNLEQHMSPGGQYFDDDPQGSPATKTYDNNWLDTYVANDNYPGTPSTAFVTLMGTLASTCGPSSASSWTNWGQVRSNWNNCYATVLVTYHPEYCHYKLCNSLDCSMAYDQVLASNNQSAAWATTPFVAPVDPPASTGLTCWNNSSSVMLNFSSPLPSSYTEPNPNPYGIMNNDPFFNGATSGTGVSNATMQSQLQCYTNYGTAGTFAPPCSGGLILVVGPGGMSMYQIAYVEAYNDMNCPTFTTSNVDNLAWQIFVGFYEKEKQAEVDTYEAGKSCLPLCDAGVVAGGVPTEVAIVSPSSTDCYTPPAANGFAIRCANLDNAIANVTPGNATTLAASAGPSNCELTGTIPTTQVGTNSITGQPIYGFEGCFPLTPTPVNYNVEVITPSKAVTVIGSVSVLSSAPILTVIIDICNAVNKNTSTTGFTAGYITLPSGNYALTLSVISTSPLASQSNVVGLTWFEGNNTCEGNSFVQIYPQCPQLVNCFCTLITDVATAAPFNLNMASLPPSSDPVYQAIATQVNNTYSLYTPPTSVVQASDVYGWLQNCNAGGTPNGTVAAASPPAAANCDGLPPCSQDAYQIAGADAYNQYEEELAAAEQQFIGQYVAGMFQPTYYEDMQETYPIEEYHYTLYYYDQAGDLTHSVPPAGVTILTPLQVISVAAYRATGSGTPYLLTFPASLVVHNKITTHQYNTLHEPVYEQTPDAGITTHYYDAVGRLRFSQNAVQAAYTITSPPIGYGGEYSYIKYDAQGRPLEAGQSYDPYPITTPPFGIPFYNGVNDETFPINVTQVTHTYYDNVSPVSTAYLQGQFDDGGQQNLRSRVATITFSASGSGYDNATHYSYDELGFVTNVIQENTDLAFIGQQYKKMSYQYDLVSGNMNIADYQPGQLDRFIHRYEYDADNRITNAYTSTDSVIWDQDAKYFYYLHKPIGREELGQDKVHGCDYAYTIDSRIKGVNSNVFNQAYDIGQDGSTGSGYSSINPGIHENVAQDAYGYTLSYFGGDYSAINGALNTPLKSFYNNGQLNNASEDLFNGNVKQVDMALTAPNGAPLSLMDNHYKYDQLNRLMYSLPYVSTGTNYTTETGTGNPATTAFGTQYSYDPDGNIQTLTRIDNAGIQTNNLQYNYVSTGRNWLDNVQNTGFPSPNDIQSGQATGNYDYNNIGELTQDLQANISAITWGINGKVLSMSGAGSLNQPDIYFKYDAKGERIEKLVEPRAGGVLSNQNRWEYTYYVRDATENIMAIYERKFTPVSGPGSETISLEESPIYGSTRIGNFNRNNLILAQVNYVSGGFNSDGTIIMNSPVQLYINPNPSHTNYSRNLGYKSYELTDYLDNVLMTISDRKLGSPGSAISLNSANNVNYYIADIASATDYYPFGQNMPGRVINNTYRFGYNDMEKDDEIKGAGNSYTTEFREYDPRLGRWMSIDPIFKPEESPYSSLSNNPIINLDPKGNDWYENDKGEIRWNDARNPLGTEVGLKGSYDTWKDISGNDNPYSSSITIITNSYIPKPNDVPVRGTDGVKIQTQVTLTGNYDENGVFYGFSYQYKRYTGETFNNPLFLGTEGVPGKTNTPTTNGVNPLFFANTLTIETHSEVNIAERWALDAMGHPVDVNQQLTFSIDPDTKQLSISISHGTYPSVEMMVSLDFYSFYYYQYSAQSFVLSHADNVGQYGMEYAQQRISDDENTQFRNKNRAQFEGFSAYPVNPNTFSSLHWKLK